MELGAVFVAPGMAKGACFALRVSGDSMIDAGIWDGDFLIVERTAIARDGDIVVALLDGETTVKRYARSGGGSVVLKPENRRLKPIPVEGREFSIQGKVIGLHRSIVH
jgi:repressor LexA